MIAAAGLLSAVLGTVLAYAAQQYPERTKALETYAGLLLIGGLALTGYAMPVMF